MKKLILLVVTLVGHLALAGGPVLRANALTPEDWARLRGGDAVVEFRQGDRLPLTTTIKGDLLESLDAVPTYIGVKRGFFLKMAKDGAQMSYDGTQFRPLQEMVRGSVALGAAGDVASSMSLVVEAYAKP